MDITYLGESGFHLRGREGSLVVDPAPHPGRRMNARAVLLSAYAVEPDVDDSDVRVINRPGEYEVSGILIRAIRTSRAAANADTSGPGDMAYTVTIDGVAICHLGRLTRVLTAAETAELGEPDVLLLPVGGQETLPPGLAAQVVTRLSPRIIIPMLWEGEISRQAATDGPSKQATQESRTAEPATTVSETAGQETPKSATPAPETSESETAQQQATERGAADQETVEGAPRGTGVAETETAEQDAPEAPMPVETVSIPSLEPFLKELGIRNLTPQDRLSVTPTNQPATQQVTLLTPRPLPR